MGSACCLLFCCAFVILIDTSPVAPFFVIFGGYLLMVMDGHVSLRSLEDDEYCVWLTTWWTNVLYEGTINVCSP